MIPDVVTTDFETKGILSRPQYPPKPTSLALRWPDNKYDLMSWGHPTGNNCTEKEARARYLKARNSKWPLLYQNGMFDMDVAEVHWDISLPEYDQWHDTMFLIFMDDPHAESLSLKPSAERLLGIAPEEQDRMYDWIRANVPAAIAKPSEAGAYICDCPYQIVRPYHKGDLTRTWRIFKLLYPRIVDVGMKEAYERELKLMPILLDAARQGMRIDISGIEKDLPTFKASVERADNWLRKRLKRPELNIASDAQLGQALYDLDLVKEWTLTKKGKLSVSKKNLKLDDFVDKRIHHVLQYRNQMSTCISMFLEPWLELAGTGDRIYPNWAQVRSPKGDKQDTKGARSGRIICSKPNFLNIPKKWKRAISTGYKHPEWVSGISMLPYVRNYALPDKGDMWGRRDYNQQELRLYGHFEEGPVQAGFLSSNLTRPCLRCGAKIGQPCKGLKPEQFHKERDFDLHEIVRAEEERQLKLAKLRDEFERDLAKITVFGRVYGQGLSGLMDALNLNEGERKVAQVIQRAINAAVPSIKELDDQLKELAAQDLPIRTWGGRLYYCEESKFVEKFGRVMDFAYKLLNYLIQGSGADVTKETIVRWHAHPKREARLIVTVYDEIDFGAPKKAMLREHTILRDSMLSIETDVPMLSDGEVGESWGRLEAFAI